jgi:hypothetical protein
MLLSVTSGQLLPRFTSLFMAVKYVIVLAAGMHGHSIRRKHMGVQPLTHLSTCHESTTGPSWGEGRQPTTIVMASESGGSRDDDPARHPEKLVIHDVDDCDTYSNAGLRTDPRYKSYRKRVRSLSCSQA